MYQIVRERAHQGLNQATIEGPALRLISQSSSDAYSVIELLWRAAKLAETEADPQVNRVHVHRSQHKFAGISPELRIQ
ncbi:hypothetical protein CEE45_04800 [Candidatus Heimdallarchaeota archaeon B3_Heim]|nr:MAG: hypothetical protein CEE45_04800 [Candidatus Heimdallarchaeota archaeon B3_Heim]